MVIVLTATFDLRGAIGFSGVTILTYYAITNVACLTLPSTQRRWPRWIAIAGVAGCIALSLTLPVVSVITGAAVLLVGLVVEDGGNCRQYERLRRSDIGLPSGSLMSRYITDVPMAASRRDGLVRGAQTTCRSWADASAGLVPSIESVGRTSAAAETRAGVDRHVVALAGARATVRSRVSRASTRAPSPRPPGSSAARSSGRVVEHRARESRSRGSTSAG